MSNKAILIIITVVIVVVFTTSVLMWWKIRQVMLDLRVDVMKAMTLEKPAEVPVPNDPEKFIEATDTETTSEEVDTNEIDSYSI